ncbi:hypothetical protein D3P07_03075 [Paenibacillus sp. 1011MAR3C5]|uniref:hypothetical protein n=1 Tax=Paenibacillus sp. 1011MAR3C5 TaxID=1675787 RepID=UPI000E6BB2A6|nr:hypothetical protein [Paenibacillus sp. 1011MAR3C5]RJE91068.1 hypothetical protein D3P07_03075 [Paenibacillus sp. 1011MAR3C5]
MRVDDIKRLLSATISAVDQVKIVLNDQYATLEKLEAAIGQAELSKEDFLLLIEKLKQLLQPSSQQPPTSS